MKSGLRVWKEIDVRSAKEHRGHEGHKGGYRHLTFVSMVSFVLIGGESSGLGPTTAAQQPPDGASIYKTACAGCHEQPQARTPSREALRDRMAEAVLQSLTAGSMAVIALPLSLAEKRTVAEYVTGKPLSASSELLGLCATRSPMPADLGALPQWNGWGIDLANSRYQPKPGFTAAAVPKLTLKWAFGFPGGTQAYGQPAIVGGRVFVGSDTGRFYGLDAASGCTHWWFEADGGIRSAPTVGPLKPGTSGRYAVYFGDLKGSVYALDASSGELIWKRRVDDHRSARVTGAPKLHDGRLYVPVSSVEEGPAAQPTYECCTFRGSVVALDAATGSVLWKTYTIPDAPRQAGRNAAGTQLWKTAGAAVWSSPTIDAQSGELFIGTGNSYTAPAAATSDAVMALDLKSGSILWWNQVTPGDAFVIGCRPDRPNANCPDTVGPDYDFGNAPILRTLPGGKRLLVIGQKSGRVYGLDPDNNGKVVWEFKAGKGSALGGIEWGSAADEQNAYIPVSDVLAPPAEAGGLFALRLATGEQVWHTPAPKLECTAGRGCTGAQSAPVSVIPGVVFSGSVDGHLRAYSTSDGTILWDFNTVKEYETVNRVPAKGGSIDAAGPVIADGLLLTNSGYALWRGLPGNVLLAFSAE
jgi:polyvinyl alcohol dehydrogenase (cytochrome)